MVQALARHLSFSPATQFSKLAALFLLAALSAGCEPARELPLTGQIRLEYVRMVDSRMEFRLSNQSHQKIQMRASPTDEFAPIAWDIWWICAGSDPEHWTQGPYPRPHNNPIVFGLEAGFSSELFISSGVQAEIARAKRPSRCRIRVKRSDGAPDIVSEEFAL